MPGSWQGQMQIQRGIESTRLDNSADWAKWIGREQVYHERIEEGRVAALAASLDIDKPSSLRNSYR